MSIIQNKKANTKYLLQNRDEPELYRDMFPYTKVSRIPFDDIFVMPRPANPMFITDTTFRDGQQARPPYTVKQIAHIFDLMYQLGGRSGLIRASEFFMYSEKDRKAIEACRKKDYKFPQVTGWIRAHIDDLKIAKDMEFTEVGLLTSVSDYHVYMKLGWDREKAMENYVGIAAKALEWGITPRCHFEDITRADIYGFCIPLAIKLMELSKQSGMPVKIRLCDTMGYGVPYPGAALPRSVPRLVRAFTDDAGVPGEWLEWHGHNDFHKTLVNASTAWLYGCSGVNGTLLGFGERTGNSPIEALVIEYLSLTGNDDAADTKVISQIAKYFQDELDYKIPDNYPFAGKDFNATSAGIHVDGLAKNEEIYNIFDTKLLLDRPVPIIITDKSGKAGVAYWINHNFKLEGDSQISKNHPAVTQVYNKIMQSYEQGRNTSYSHKEMLTLVRRFIPELFSSEFDKLKKLAGELSAHLITRLAEECQLYTDKNTAEQKYPCMKDFVQEYPFIQYLYITDIKGHLLYSVITNDTYKSVYEQLPLGYDFSGREWFIKPTQTGKLHITDVYQSHFTRQLILTVSTPIIDENDNVVGVIGADIQMEQLLKRAEALEEEVAEEVEQDE
ncbi:triose-phosphate isomerase [Desulfovibrio litoralis]|uniref:Isopropylmalate/homocitrate/citramalate synthases n=1 Tax=Desulfovibrio litoralis DSM 11393 TaxID=1121455 RepID=A0A1M7TCL6_9BACT|nr:cache domain-containing protein [Desulfovibrio litoralis]SHN68509.1 Isopropylmalate/homocitrate/citramalate synthases [Desulfovibrio litoralis DSM 11393]